MTRQAKKRKHAARRKTDLRDAHHGKARRRLPLYCNDPKSVRPEIKRFANGTIHRDLPQKQAVYAHASDHGPDFLFPMQSWTDTRVDVAIGGLLHASRFDRRCSIWRGCVKFGAPNGEDDQYTGAG